MKQETPWNKLAVEAIVIVGSILLAFAIDAWWSERNETDQVNAVLAVLKLDLESSQRRLETIRSSHDGRNPH